MTDLMVDLEYFRSYIDNLLIILNVLFRYHLEKFEKVLKIAKSRSKSELAKSTFGVDECEYLGYALTRQGIKPKSKKIKAILAINPP